MRFTGLILAAVAIATQAAAEENEPPLDLAPMSKWVMDYDADSCALRRIFGIAEQQALLELRQYAPGDSFQVTVASGTIPTANRRPRVRFEPDSAAWEPATPILGTFGDNLEGVVYTDSLSPNARLPDRDEPPAPWTPVERDLRENEISGLLVENSFERDLLLRTGAMHAPMEAMRTCLDELLTHWGVDVEAHRALSRPLAPKDYERWVRRVQQYYPQSMINMHRNGYVRIRLLVGPDGNPTSCNVQLETRDTEFQEVACDILMRYARFEPALNAQGEAIASFYTTAIHYQLNRF